MTVAESEFQGGAGTPAPQARAAIRLLRIERFRGIEALTWRPGAGMNIILGGGDAGKTSILEAVALLLSPTNPATVPGALHCEPARGSMIEP